VVSHDGLAPYGDACMGMVMMAIHGRVFCVGVSGGRRQCGECYWGALFWQSRREGSFLQEPAIENDGGARVSLLLRVSSSSPCVFVCRWTSMFIREAGVSFGNLDLSARTRQGRERE